MHGAIFWCSERAATPLGNTICPWGRETKPDPSRGRAEEFVAELAGTCGPGLGQLGLGLRRQGRGVPDRHLAVVRAAGQTVTVRAKSHAPDRPLEGVEFLSGLGNQHIDRIIVRSA